MRKVTKLFFVGIGAICLGLVWTFTAFAQGLVITDQKVTLPSFQTPLDYSIYLPEKYCVNNRLYPVLYLLHGYGGSHKDWLKAGQVAKTLDRLVAKKVIDPLVVVMPAAGKSWYLNSEKHGAFQSGLGQELPVVMEGLLANKVTKETRAIAGLSMGGYGALKFAFEVPEQYIATAGLSPAVFPNIESTDYFKPVQIKLFAGAFGDPFSVEIFNRENVFTALQNAKTESFPHTYLTVGDDDWFGLYEGTFALYQELKSRKLPSELRITNGNHTWKLWRDEIEQALVFIDSKFKAERAESSSEILGESRDDTVELGIENDHIIPASIVSRNSILCS
ncbi:alpha/beta hydrolase family protein [Kiloniella sp. EL199]|uniref:alpha/beta hydrolase n=1 Tax=Kiloniella sp. EL199 TaxID=2107581 RepID=UPI000EA299E6|nr:alpha/beta hydrolase-fold protein [Kiloniella sp. EL199]